MALFASVVLLYSIGIGRTGFQGKDERRYAQVGKELTSGGSALFVMHYMGDLYPDKPPLVFWSIGLGIKLLGGVSPLAARLPLAISAVAAVLMAWLAMRQLTDPLTALVAAALMAISFRFIWAGRWLRLDMPMCAMTYGAFWATARLLFPRPDQARAGLGWAMAGWAFAAGAVLAKGPGALCWLGTIATYATVRRRWMPIAQHRPLRGLLVLTLLVGAWLIPAMALGGKAYYGPMFGVHVVERLAGTVRHEHNFLYFLYKLLSDGLPMTLLLPAALWWLWRARKDRPVDERTVFTLCWFGFNLVFFSLPSGKRGQYILPLYPAVALLIAPFLIEAARKPRALAGVVARWHLMPMALAMIGLGVLALLFPQKLEGHAGIPQRGFVPTLVFLTLMGGGGAAAFELFRRRRLEHGLVTSGAGLYLAYLLLFGLYFPRLFDDGVYRRIARTIESASIGRPRVALWWLDDRFALYGDYLPESIGSDSEASAWMAKGPGRWLLTRRKHYETCVRAMAADPAWELAGQWPDPQQGNDIVLLRSH